jgi:filamentous hemagglutinin
VDYSVGEFVVFDRTINSTFHGHVRSWNDLHPDMQNALIRAGMADRRGNVIDGGKQ